MWVWNMVSYLKGRPITQCFRAPVLKKELGPERGYVTGYWRKLRKKALHYL
jgi:hypothetical protein